MFYSQFILAKKGPLGTIWIAAHLERKLRKNQVADTDIGVSVDSILFPEAPIALRLSSHLLLGVVRIYSKKVNYLFHDCSEALLQIKQAFRSTAVDLPPEESTAPYHSITLPETFHLDDFQLPDSTYGNFVDRHISSKEQITLQDNINNTGCSTSQFGLDERFGDGDASQIGLDLDEDLFLEKDPLAPHASDPLALDENMICRGQSSVSITGMDIDEDRRDDNATEYSALFPNTYIQPEEKNIRELERPGDSISHHGYNPQTPDLNEILSPGIPLDGSSSVPYDGPIGFGDDNPPTPYLLEFDHAPSTPGLMEETNRTSFQDNPTLSPQEKTIASSSVEPEVPNGMNNNSIAHDVKAGQESTDVAEPACESEPAEHSAKLGSGQDVANDLQLDLDNGEAIQTQHIILDGTEKAQELDLTSDLPTERKMLTGASSEVGTTLHEDSAKPQSILVEQNCAENAVSFPEVSPSNDIAVAENVPEVSVREPSCVTEVVENEAHHVHGSVDGDKVNEQSAEVASKDVHSDQLNCSSSSELPEPEKMRLASRSDEHFPSDLGEITIGKGVTESDGSVDWFKKLSVRKRRLIESTPVLQNCSSTKLSGSTRLRSSDDDVPDDDDLLASILVGRRKPALRLERTPATKAASNKRPRLSSKVTKRKVLVDDIMVLHADTIRQQLINTEDIRRVRKKAPCTRPEVWMIEKSLKEDEIFEESLLTGLSPELHRLHSQSYTLEKISETDKNESIAVMTNIVDGEIEGLPGTSLSAEVLACKELQSDIQPTHSVSIVQKDEQQQNNMGNELLHASISIDEILVKENCVSLSPEKCDEACRQSDRQSPRNIDQPYDGLIGMNGENVDIDRIVDGETSIEQSKNEVTMGFSNTEGHCDVDAAVREIEDGGLGMDDALTHQCSNPDMPTEETKETNVKFYVDNDAMESLNNKHDAVPETIALDRDQLASCSVEFSVGTEAVPSSMGENYELQETNQDAALDVDSNPIEVGATRDSSDFCSAIEGNDTDFLNMDEEADYDEADIDIPNREEVQPLENSGWSSRTRGVARYLKSLFDEEYGHGRKIVAVDQLLAGKTRKEASRMFFETLVLKTRDYIDVEQEMPFDFVKIKPRMKLLKSEI